MTRSPHRPAPLTAPATLMLTLMLAWAPAPLTGQDSAQAGGPEDMAPRTLKPDDYGQWERLGRTVLSDDGRWAAIEIVRVSENNELRLTPVGEPDSAIVVAFGSGALFSANGRWAAYRIGQSKEEREKLQKQKKPVRNDLGLVDLASGEMSTIDEVASFAFSGDGTHLAFRRYPPEGKREAKGVDVIVRDLAAGVETPFGNVSEFAWSDLGSLLALVVDAEGMAGNGVQLYDATADRLLTLDSENTRYQGITWREDAGDLAVLRQVARDAEGEDAWTDTAFVALAWSGIDRGGRPGARTLAAGAPGLEPDRRIVPFQDPSWSDDGQVLFVGLDLREPAPECARDSAEAGENTETAKEGEAAEGEPGAEAPEPGPDDDACQKIDDKDKPTVEIWNARDVDIVPTQKVRADRDRRENDLAAWHVSEGRLVALENELTETVRPVDGTSIAVGIDDTPYEADRMFGPAYQDVYVVNIDTGDRDKALERVQYFLGASPAGRYLLWLQDDDVWSYEVATATRRNLTHELPTSFVNLRDDHPVEQKPPYGMGGWLDDDAAVLLYDRHDVWRVAPDGSKAERITDGAEANVRHRVVRLDPDQDAFDRREPLYFSLYNDWTEEWGYGRADRPGARVERRVWGPARYSSLRKADEADVYAYTSGSFEDSPDVFAGGPGLGEARQLTHTNPFQGDYLWGKSELIAYQNAWGDTLQGSLYYPADYQPGRTYPMIVYIYEIVSPAVRSYQIPSERNYYNPQTWVQNGYFVYQPDIVYRDRDPGISAVAALEPAVAAVVATGMVDPDRVGLVGHSWGGYQTTFTVTQTDVFAAAVAGAPLTNLFSMYLSVYWNSGGTDARIFEISQGRMEVPFWEDEDAYKRNSPVFHIENMHTPLLMAQGTEDGAVDFNQGVEFYNAARRAGKDFVYVVYNGENHGFRTEANQKDYYRRINEWFGHYLKGEPAPDWITEGVPYLEQQKVAKPGGR